MVQVNAFGLEQIGDFSECAHFVVNEVLRRAVSVACSSDHKLRLWNNHIPILVILSNMDKTMRARAKSNKKDRRTGEGKKGATEEGSMEKQKGKVHTVSMMS